MIRRGSKSVFEFGGRLNRLNVFGGQHRLVVDVEKFLVDLGLSFFLACADVVLSNFQEVGHV